VNVANEAVTAGMRRAQSNSPPPTPAPAPHTATSLQKMKEQGMYRNQYFKDAECFDCGHKFKTGRSAKSANCPSCGAYISLEDVEINMTSTQSIKTRGDVLIRKRGRLSASSVHCRDLECHGIIEANVTCSGDATFRTTGSIIGEIRCNRFVVEKGADVAFLNTVHATEVEIQARVTGTIYSSGPVLIGSGGAVNGDVTARSVSIEPGGELNGAMNIVRGKQPAPPPAS
jgi:cytoskeletal protein CcmA (bactofilin family)/ribosomal protein S27E